MRPLDDAEKKRLVEEFRRRKARKRASWSTCAPCSARWPP
jgi:hypothetical protein